MLFRDFRGYQELMFGACVRNAMFFATFPYYVSGKCATVGSVVRPQTFWKQGQRYRAIRALGRKPSREAARTAPNPRTTRYVPKRTSQCASLTKGDL